MANVAPTVCVAEDTGCVDAGVDGAGPDTKRLHHWALTGVTTGLETPAWEVLGVGVVANNQVET